jgi:hypothetical protein
MRMADKLFFGALAGALSAFVFTAIHDLMISNIWFMLVPMALAGAVCGMGLALSYALLVDSPTAGGWLRYNLLYLLLLFGLAPLSLLLFEPVTTIPALLASPDGLPAELIREILPLAAVYTLFMALFITWLYGRRWSRLVVVLPTCAVLVLLLGLNIAAFGLVHLTSGWAPLMLELLGLVVALNLVYVVVFYLLARDWFAGPAVASAVK